MKVLQISLMVALAITTPIVSSTQFSQSYVFLDAATLKNNLEGSLAGTVKFAQTHTIDAVDNDGKEMPHLISSRETLVMLIPEQKTTSLVLKVYNKKRQLLGTLDMLSPDKLPKADRPENAPNPDVIYSDKAWHQILPAKWVQPGLILTFNAGNELSGSLNHIDIGGETQVVLQNIRIGMLTEPGPLEKNPLEKNSEALAKDYFQKIPVSQLIVGNYSPVYLQEVVLSSGQKYETHSNDTGGVYDGDMRENIGKNLISMGIDNANFGINSSVGHTGWQPALFHIVAVHQSWGNYINGRIQHGLSGGNGMATLWDTVGNEFSHELGHGYGMGHYPGGGQWSIHHPHSGWGWDAVNNRFIANFFWDRTGEQPAEESGDNHITPPFMGIHQFNRDTMGGGHPSSQFSKYVLHTGYTQKRIQQWLENKAVITPHSSSGFLIWDSNKKEMVEATGEYRRKPSEFGVPVTTLVGFYDPKGQLESYIYPALHGSYGYVYAPQAPKAGQCWAEVSYQAHAPEKFALDGIRFKADHMNKFHINVATRKKPQSLSISCPEQDIDAIFNTWKLNKLGTDTIHSWSSNDPQATLGSVYYSDRGYYFRLMKKPYWYFPTTQENNQDWNYITDQETLVAQFEQENSTLSPDHYGEKIVAETTIRAAVTAPMPAVTVGYLLNDANDLPTADAGQSFTVTGTTDHTRYYQLDGSASQNAASYSWSIVEGQDSFFFRKEDTNEWSTWSNSPTPEALIPANKTGRATYLLTVTGHNGKTAESRVTVTVEAPQQNNDQAFIDGLTLSVNAVDKGDMVEFSSALESSAVPSSTPGYVWTLPGTEQGNDGALQVFSIVQQEQEQLLKVTALVTAGAFSRKMEKEIVVPAKEQGGGNAPAWDVGKTYAQPCNRVTYNGKIWLNGWWTSGDLPDNSGQWGVWRQEGDTNMHGSCR